MELQGVRFGRLTVVARAKEGGRIPWVCICDCGKSVIKSQVDLRAGDTRSCGCLRKEVVKNKNTTHNLTHTKAYSKWRSMWARVRSSSGSKNACYSGINICKRWLKFEHFYADMGEPPEGYSLDRISNRKGYSRSNCRWVPLADQARNTSRTVWYNGMCLSEAARSKGLSPNCVFDRIAKLGWSIEEALTTPLRMKRKQHA